MFIYMEIAGRRMLHGEPATIVSRSYSLVRQPRFKTILNIQATLFGYIREFLNERGFVELLPPIIGPVTDPGIRGAKQVTIDYYGREYKVMSSAILYKQMMASALERIYFFSPNVRLEPPETILTGRHLVEFIQVDLEVANVTYDYAMRLAEEMLHYVVKRATEEKWRELEQLGRLIRIPRLPFKRITHKQAVDEIRKYLAEDGKDPEDISYNTEIPWEYEKLISEKNPEPFFIHDYVKGSRGFYDREDPDRPGILRDFDLIYPDGYGEAASGAEREYEYQKVFQRIRNQGEDPSKYGWYLEMLKEGIPLTAGFGIGIERLTRFVCGKPFDPVWMFRPYPKLPGIYSP